MDSIEDIMLEKFRKQFQEKGASDSAQLHRLLFSIRLREYCYYLVKLSRQTKCFEMCYERLYDELLHYYYQVIPSKMSKAEQASLCSWESLTVGNMLQKAADMVCHSGDYSSRLSNNSSDIKQAGAYITDMLIVRPFVMLKIASARSEFHGNA